MNEFEQARQFGLIDIPSGMQCFRAFIDRYNSIMVQTAGQPIRGMWQGNQIIIEMSSGDTLVYNSLSPAGYYRVSR
jgi:hypothetical protein